MSRFLSRLLVLMAAVQMLGGHWVLLQSAAWVRMVAAAVEHDSLGVAVKKALDGEHPCDLCLVVKNGRETERKQTPVPIELKLEAILAVGVELPPRTESRREVSSRPEGRMARSQAPPVPPPRVA